MRAKIEEISAARRISKARFKLLRSAHAILNYRALNNATVGAEEAGKQVGMSAAKRIKKVAPGTGGGSDPLYRRQC